jgi:transposase
MVVVDGQGIPLGNLLESASPAEVTLLEPTLDTIAVPRSGPGRPRKNPERVIYDKACDSDPLRKRLARRGIELICPHRRNRVKPPLQDGRKLRRYRRRWRVERTFAWLGNFRRLVVRWERHIRMYRAFFHVACLLITVRQLWNRFYYGHLVLRLMGCLVLFYTSRVICKGQLTMEEIIFSLKHYWRFVDCEALELKALSQGVNEKAAWIQAERVERKIQHFSKRVR